MRKDREFLGRSKGGAKPPGSLMVPGRVIINIMIISHAQASPLTKPRPWIYTPRDFRPEDYPGPIAKHPEAARWLLNCIYFKRLFRNYADDEFVNLHSRLLSVVIGKKGWVKPLREQMEEARLIDCDHTWVLDHKSLGYRVGSVLQGATWCRYEPKGKCFANRVRKFKDHIRKPSGLKLPVHAHLRSWAEKVELLEELPVLSFGKEKKAELAAAQVSLLREGLIHCSVSDYGRFHSNYSGLVKELRPFLRANGECLHEIDIVNSQPFFLAMLLLETLLTGNCVPKISLLFPPKGEEEKKLPYVPPFGGQMFEKKTPPDLQSFLGHASSGTFYETFQQACELTRDEIKPKVFQVLYGPKHVMENSLLTRAFMEIYPSVFEMTLELKQQKGHKWVVQELQRRESRLVINGVCDTLRRDHPDVPVISIHDSVMTTQQHLGLVRRLLEDQFSQFPLRPLLRIKG